ncbi:MAG: ribosome maturation factor RimP [candidate division WOR-3 bacterium]
MLNEKIKEIIDEVCQTFGLLLYDLEYDMKTLRVYIDTLDKKDTVTIETCARFSEALSLRLDLLDLIDHPYTLEVSSPGVERKLKEPWHFKAVLGRRVQIIFSREGKTEFLVGELLTADEEKIAVLDERNRKLEIKYSDIKTAQLKVSSKELFQGREDE